MKNLYCYMAITEQEKAAFLMLLRFYTDRVSHFVGGSEIDLKEALRNYQKIVTPQLLLFHTTEI